MTKKKSKKGDFIQKAFYPGGRDALKKFISENLQYPKDALENKVEGTVHAEYQVNHRGRVIRVKPLTNLGHGLEEEAVRLTKLLKFAVPQKVRNIRVTFNKTIWINFKLPKQSAQPTVSTPVKQEEQEVTPQPQVQYTVVPTPKQEEVKEEKPKQPVKKINYTVNL